MSATESATDWFAITPSDTVNLPQKVRGIWVGVGGDVSLVSESGGVETFKNAASGVIIMAQPVRINSTGTTATDLKGLV